MARLCILLTVVGMCCTLTHSTPEDQQVLTMINQYCERQRCGSVNALLSRIGITSTSMPSVEEEPAAVDLVAMNETIVEMLQGQIRDLNSKMEEIIAKSKRQHRRTQEDIQVLKRKLSIPGEWYRANNGFMYEFVPTHRTWVQAIADCRKKGATLVSAGIRNPMIRRELISRANYMFWTGMTDAVREGDWQWIDGVAGSTRDEIWAAGEPNDVGANEDCAVMFPLGEVWKANDLPCATTSFPYFCEKRI